MNCRVCQEPIPEARLQAVPGTDTCVKHSSVSKIKGFNVIEHKTGNWVQVIPDSGLHAELVKLDSDKGRGRTGYAGAH